MKLAPGARLGPYEILAPLGAGGMGEVYRARDSRLGRDVAIKVLPERFAADAEGRRRFEVEARAAAAIEHPAVVAIYDVGVETGAPYLVTELLSGSTLREVVARGALPLARAREIMRALLEGLGAAHARGIVHRDLKPENVFITREGRVKLLDFGLAKLLEPLGAPPAGASFAGTVSGQLLGTAGYMAPEQIHGEAVDPRADLFAAGVVLYEMLTGVRPFGGKSPVDTLHAILNLEPPALSSRQSGLPAALDAVVSRCLAKAPDQRFQSAKDLAFALELASGGAGPAAGVRVSAPTAGPALVASAAILAVAVAFAAWALLAARGKPAATPAWAGGTFTPLTVDPGYEGEPTLSPDGETVAYTSDRNGNFELYLQQVGGGTPINLTNDAADDVQPAFSPDGRELAFASTRSSRLDLIYRTPGTPLMGGDIWIMPSLGGMARRVSEDGNFPTWSPDGKTLYFIRATWFFPELRRVAATGGSSVEVPIEFPPGFRANSFQEPRVSPDGHKLLFGANGQLFVMPARGGRAVPLAVGRGATWDHSGHAVLFCNTSPGRNSGLWRVAVSDSGGPAGPAEPLLVGPAGCDKVELSGSGRRLVLAIREVTGNLEELALDADAGISAPPPRALTQGANDISFLTASHDGKSQVYTDARGASEHLWRLDPGREPVQLTTDPAWLESYPRWSPDGGAIAFVRRPAGEARVPDNQELWLMAPDGGSQRRIVEHGGHMAWLPAGRLVYIHGGRLRIVDTATGADQAFDIRGPEPMPIFAASPDGKWLVYQSSVKDKGVDIAVASIPDGRARWLARSEREDYHPSFSPSGKWVYFQKDHRNMWRVPGPAQGWREAPPQQVTFMKEPGLFHEDPQICGDGRRLLYSRVQTRGDLWMVDLPPAEASKGGR